MVTAMIWCAATCVHVGMTLATGPIDDANRHDVEIVRAKTWVFDIGVIAIGILATLYVNGIG